MDCSTSAFVLFMFWCFTSGLCARYKVYVLTGYYKPSSRVELRLVGDGGRTAAHNLIPRGGSFHSKDIFIVNDRDVGKLNGVELYLHDGSSSRWWLNMVVVSSAKGLYSFFYNHQVPTGKWIVMSMKCPLGFQKGPSGACDDIDECKKNPCKGPLAKCQNTIGSYSCVCPRGYRVRYGGRCEDIDECREDRTLCNQLCVNTPGSYRCKCRSGYKLVEGKCFDRNECQDGSHNCDSESTYCSNVRGGFYCYCNPGYRNLNSTHCEAQYCGKFTPDNKTTYSPSRCTKDNANKYKDICTRGCHYGYELRGPTYKTVTCTLHGWRGTFRYPPSYCIGVKCPPLPAIKNGFYYPMSCGITGGRYEERGCEQMCNGGYKEVGGTTYQCQSNGKWIGTPVTCKKIHPAPVIDCPYRIRKILPVGKNSASLGSLWKRPKSNYNNLTVSPAGVDSQYVFPAGTTVLTWTVTNPDGKTASCKSRIVIQDNEPPKVDSCPDVFYPTQSKRPYFVKFKEPRFTDNVGVVRVEYMFAKYQNGGVMLNHSSNVILEAYDQAGNVGRCMFTVYIGGSKCTLLPDNNGYGGTWMPLWISGSYRVLRMCPSGTMVFGGSFGIQWYSCDESTGKWTPDKVTDCVGFSSANKTSHCPVGYVKKLYKMPQKYYCLQCPRGTSYQKTANGHGTCIACPEGTFQDKKASTTCNKCPAGTSSLKENHKCRDLCPRGSFSKDGMHPFCTLCPEGHYQPKAGQTSCLNCAANKFTNTKLGSFSCQDVKPPNPEAKGLLEIRTIIKPNAWDFNSKSKNKLECYIKDNKYNLVSVQWQVDNKGIPADFLGKIKHEEIRDAAGKPVGSRLIVTKATSHNAKIEFTCVATNPNGAIRKTVKVPIK